MMVGSLVKAGFLGIALAANIEETNQEALKQGSSLQRPDSNHASGEVKKPNDSGFDAYCERTSYHEDGFRCGLLGITAENIDLAIDAFSRMSSVFHYTPDKETSISPTENPEIKYSGTPIDREEAFDETDNFIGHHPASKHPFFEHLSSTVAKQGINTEQFTFLTESYIRRVVLTPEFAWLQAGEDLKNYRYDALGVFSAPNLCNQIGGEVGKKPHLQILEGMFGMLAPIWGQDYNFRIGDVRQKTSLPEMIQLDRVRDELVHTDPTALGVAQEMASGGNGKDTFGMVGDFCRAAVLPYQGYFEQSERSQLLTYCADHAGLEVGKDGLAKIVIDQDAVEYEHGQRFKKDFYDAHPDKESLEKGLRNPERFLDAQNALFDAWHKGFDALKEKSEPIRPKKQFVEACERDSKSFVARC